MFCASIARAAGAETRALELESAEFLASENARLNRVARKVLAAVPERADGAPKQAWLPFTFIGLDARLRELYGTSKDAAVLVENVFEDPSKLDLRKGDEILAFQGMEIHTMKQLVESISATKEVATVRLRLGRQGKEWDVDVPVSYFAFSPKFVVTATNGQAYLDWSETEFFTVVVSPPLMRMAETDDELAFAVAHEAAHIAKDHKKSMRSNPTGTALNQAMISLLSAALKTTPTVAQWQFVPGPYFEKDEAEADAVAVGYMKAAGYDPGAALTFLQKMEIEIKPGAPGSIRETHPSSIDRIALLKRKLASGDLGVPAPPPAAAQDNTDGLLGPDFSTGAVPGELDLIDIGLAECTSYNFGYETELQKDALVFTNDPKRVAWHAKSSYNPPFHLRPERFDIEWFAPDGSLRLGREIKFLPGNELTNSIAWTQEEAAKVVGRWRVRVATKSGKVVDDRYFLIKDTHAKILKKRSEVFKNPTGGSNV